MYTHNALRMSHDQIEKGSYAFVYKEETVNEMTPSAPQRVIHQYNDSYPDLNNSIVYQHDAVEPLTPNTSLECWTPQNHDTTDYGILLLESLEVPENHEQSARGAHNSPADIMAHSAYGETIQSNMIYNNQDNNFYRNFDTYSNYDAGFGSNRLGHAENNATNYRAPIILCGKKHAYEFDIKSNLLPCENDYLFERHIQSGQTIDAADYPCGGADTTTPTQLSTAKQYTVGRWDPDEHEQFIRGLELYKGPAWGDISKLIGSRTSTQVRTHAQKFFTKLARSNQSFPHFEEHIEKERQRLMAQGLLKTTKASSQRSPRPRTNTFDLLEQTGSDMIAVKYKRPSSYARLSESKEFGQNFDGYQCHTTRNNE